MIVLAMIFEVDPELANPDDLKQDEAAAAAAEAQYSAHRSGPLAILPCSICYVPLAHFLPPDRLSGLHIKAGGLAVFDSKKKIIQTKRLDGDANLGQIEYIFDLGNWNPYFKSEPGKKYGTMLQILQYPFSVGSIHIGTSGHHMDPHIDPDYYGGAHGALDAAVMRECARFLDRVIHTEPLAEIILAPAFPPPGTIDDEANLKKWVAENTITDWHPVGTCGMSGGGGIRNGVVDERLRVHGVKGLRVVDASIMPLQISAHLQATVYAIAEKGAHMILEDTERAG